MAKNTPIKFIRRKNITGYGKASRFKSGLELDPKNITKKPPNRTPVRFKPQKLTKQDQFVTSEPNRWKLYGRKKPVSLKGPEAKQFLSGQLVAVPEDSTIELPDIPQGEKARIIFTGQNKAKFKMGNKMRDIVNQGIKKYGKENIVLVHGGKPDDSIIDKNIKKLGEHTGIPTVADPIDTSKKNAGAIRRQQRNEDPTAIQLSFDSKGDLNLKDKYEDWARETYENLGKETVGEGDVRDAGLLKWPKKEGKSLSKSTTDTTKFKSFLDILEDEKNPEKVKSGLKHARKLSKWSEENVGNPLITDKNIHRIDHIEHGVGLGTGKRLYKTYDDFEQNEYIEDTNVLGREGQTEYGGSGKLPFKAESQGTLLAPRVGTRNVTRSFEYSGYGTEGSTYDHKAKKAIPKIQNYTVTEIKKISAGSKKPPPPRQQATYSKIAKTDAGYRWIKKGIKSTIEGPDMYPSKSSMTQIENTELAKPTEHNVARELRQGTSQTVEADEMQQQINKREDAQSVQRHKGSYLAKQFSQKDISNLSERIKQAKSIQRKNRRIQRTKSKVPYIGVNSPAVQRILGTIPDSDSIFKQSATVEDIKSPKIYGDLSKTTKEGRDKLVKADIKKGPQDTWLYSKEKVIRQNKSGVVTAKARHTVLTGGKSIRPASYPSLWRVDRPNVKFPSGFWNPSKTYTKPSQKIVLPKPKTKIVTTDVTPIQNKPKWWKLKHNIGAKAHVNTLKKLMKETTGGQGSKWEQKINVQATKKVTEKVSKGLQKKLHTVKKPPNVEYKHRPTDIKHGKSVGKGIKFTRGIGAFSILSTTTGVLRARKEAKQYTGKKEPSFFDTMKMMYPALMGKPKKKFGLNPGDA